MKINMNESLLFKHKVKFLELLKENYDSNVGCFSTAFSNTINTCKECPFYKTVYNGCGLYYDEAYNYILREKRNKIIITIIKQYYGEEILFDWLV